MQRIASMQRINEDEQEESQKEESDNSDKADNPLNDQLLKSVKILENEGRILSQIKSPTSVNDSPTRHSRTDDILSTSEYILEIEDDPTFDWEKDEACSENNDDISVGHGCWHRIGDNGRSFLKYLICILITALPGAAVVGSVTWRKGAEFELTKGELKYKVFVWSCFGCFSVVIFWVLKQSVQISLVIFKMNVKRRWGSTLEYITKARVFLVLTLWFSVLYISWLFVLEPMAECGDGCPLWWLNKAILALIVTSLMFFLQRIFVHHVARSFHKTAYEERLSSLRFAQRVIDKLNSARKNKSKSPTKTSKVDFMIKNDHTPKKKMEFDTFSEAKTGDRISDVWRRLFSNVAEPGNNSSKIAGIQDVGSSEEARKVARKIFEFLSGGVERSSLSVEHFRLYFKDAEQVLRLFDGNGNNVVSRREMKDTIVDIYKERRFLNDSMLCIEDVSEF